MWEDIAVFDQGSSVGWRIGLASDAMLGPCLSGLPMMIDRRGLVGRDRVDATTSSPYLCFDNSSIELPSYLQ
jgi:hypothetical protein